MFFERGDYEQAVNDWKFIIENTPSSEYADDALIALGEYALSVEKDLKKAIDYFQKVLDNYATRDKAPAAFYYLGKIKAKYGINQKDFDDAIANFERVFLIHPKSEWAGPASISAAELYSLEGDTTRARAYCNRALRRRLSKEYNELAWICIVRAWAMADHPQRALDAVHLYQLKHPFTSTNDIVYAATVLYRHYIRSETFHLPYYSDDAFKFSVPFNLKKPNRLYLTQENNIFVIDVGRDWILQFDSHGKFKEKRSIANLDNAYITPSNLLYYLAKGQAFHPRFGRQVLGYTVAGGKFQTFEPDEIAGDDAGFLWVAKNNGVLFYERGVTIRMRRVVWSLASQPDKIKRLEIDPFGRLWILMKDYPYVRVFSRSGRLAPIQPRIQQKMFKDPIGIGWDILGFTYVLDRKMKTIKVFKPNGQVLKTIDISTLLGDIDARDLEVGPDGSLYILDGKTKRVFHLI